jgi:hypothetical protein
MASIYLFNMPLIVIALNTLVLIILFNWLGHYYRRRQLKKYPGVEPGHLGAIEGALLGLLTLMLAFSYGIAATRYEVGRQLIVDESKIFTVAVHRCDLYPDSIRNKLRNGFKNYVESRIIYFTAGIDEDRIAVTLKEGNQSLERIRKELIAVPQNQDNHFHSLLMIPALDNVEDVAISSEAARLSKLPQIILWMLLIMTVACSFLVGFVNTGNRKNLIMVAAFALMTTAAFYLVIELDHPRQGLINLDVEIQNIINLRNLFTENT